MSTSTRAQPLEPAFQIVEQAVADGSIPGASVLIMQRGKVIAERAFGVCEIESSRSFRTDTVCWIASLTKPITATAAMKLVEQGKLQLDAPISKYLPEFSKLATADGQQHVVTIRQLMSHSSGIPASVPLREPFFFTQRWLDRGLPEVVDAIAKRPLDFAPGTKVNYSNAAPYVLGRIIEVSSGENLDDFMKREIFEPLLMNDTGFSVPSEKTERTAIVYRREKNTLSIYCRYDPSWQVKMTMPDGGLFSTPSDMARFANLFINQGQGVLTQDSVRTMLTQQSAGYGLGWILDKPNQFSHWGSSGTLVWGDQQSGVVGVFFSQIQDFESLSGWKLLFDGKTTEGWRNYKKESISDGWKVEDGALVRAGKDAGDIVTKKKYKYFELSLNYKISEGGNSGLMFHVTEDNPVPWHSGPEVQIQDNVAGHDPQKSGWLYQLFKPTPPNWVKETGTLDATRPAGEWNQLFLRIAPNQCEVSMNGALYYRFKIGDDKWNEAVKQSKFAKFPGFGTAGEGAICLQDHGNLVAFRDIKIRELAEDGSVQQPIDGKLKVRTSPAFPKLQWEGWEPIDENGKANKPLRILELTFAKGDGNRLFAMDQGGLIFTFENRPDVESAKLFLDLQGKASRWFDKGANEQGLLGLALHPNFKENGELFVNYTQRDNHHTIVSRFRVSKTDRLKADPDSEEILLDIPQPFQNHNGGPIEFGPDGYLYIALGDGGSRNDPNASGQDRSDLLASILRIDVNSKSQGRNYGIPSDNPLVGVEGCRPEIFAYGLRNPWRISFDSKSGRLWCGDVGQELWEEVNVITKGSNYGWSSREGSYAFGNRPNVDGVAPFTDPVWEYDHSVGKSVTGGRVYNSGRVKQLTGKYLYADYVSGSVWALTYDPATGKAVRNEQVIENGIPVMAFGEDQNGEVYSLIDSGRGQCIYRFDADE